MSNGRKLSGSGSNQSQTKIFPPGTGSSDSSSALTVENVERMEEEDRTSKEDFSNQGIQDYINQTNLACFHEETTKKATTELFWDAEPEGATSYFPAEAEEASSSFPKKQSENGKEVCWKISEEISRKDKPVTGIFQQSVRGKEGE